MLDLMTWRPGSVVRNLEAARGRSRLIRRAAVLALLISSAMIGPVSAGDPPLPVASPAEVGMVPERLEAIDRIVAEGLRDRKLPGCVVIVGHRGKLVLRKAYGQRRVKPESEEMTLDTIFDLASLTKPISTATSIHRLVEQGKLELDAPVARYLPDFAANGKEGITIRHLLLHTSGLIPDNAIGDYLLGPQKAWEKIMALKPDDPLDQRFRYSDVNFLVLGKLVERASGRPINEYARDEIFTPLGMKETGYLPPKELLPRIAPTEKKGETWITGFVHDPRALALGGVAGHAGLFSTADDLAIYAQTILNGGEWKGTRILSAESVARMTAPHDVPGKNSRTLGWDNRSAYSGNRGDLLSPRAFGHGGFTGTGIWIDPEQQLFVIFLSSRLHPTGDGVVNPLIGRICTVAAASRIPSGNGEAGGK